MKITKNKLKEGLLRGTKPERNQSKKNTYIIVVAVVTALLIIWVYAMGRKANETVPVVMIGSTNIARNEVITEDKLQPYEMIKGEFEKYAVVQSNGTSKRRILLWEERGKIINSFAAYTLKANTVAEYKDFIKSRTDNSDNVLYSFPGKDIVKLEISNGDLQAYKSFLQPGDRLNIDSVYSQKETVIKDDGYGGQEKETLETFKSESLFKDIMIADLLNQSGDSILDIYSSYNDKTTYQQAELDASQTFQDSVTPKSLLVALTPEEKKRYYYYLGKSQVEFKASLPQRVE